MSEYIKPDGEPFPLSSCFQFFVRSIGFERQKHQQTHWGQTQIATNKARTQSRAQIFNLFSPSVLQEVVEVPKNEHTAA